LFLLEVSGERAIFGARNGKWQKAAEMLPLTLDSMNRSAGLVRAVPEVFAPVVNEKRRCDHRLIDSARAVLLAPPAAIRGLAAKCAVACAGGVISL
jgi:hypothetical protein